MILHPGHLWLHGKLTQPKIHFLEDFCRDTISIIYEASLIIAITKVFAVFVRTIEVGKTLQQWAAFCHVK